MLIYYWLVTGYTIKNSSIESTASIHFFTRLNATQHQALLQHFHEESPENYGNSFTIFIELFY
jgi:hypothetical protein